MLILRALVHFHCAELNRVTLYEYTLIYPKSSFPSLSLLETILLMNILACISLCAHLRIYLRHRPEGEIAGSMVHLSSTLLTVTRVPSKALVPVYTPTQSVQEFLFLPLHAQSPRNFYFCQSTGCKMLPHYGFNLNFPDYFWDGTPLYAYWTFGFSLLWLTFSFLWLVFFFSPLSCFTFLLIWSYLCILGININIRLYPLTYSFTIAFEVS